MGAEVLAALESLAESRGLVLDVSQLAVVTRLQKLYADLLLPLPFVRITLLRQMLNPHPLRGLYIWGGVGRGKSFLMDGFFKAVPLAHKRRVHFHHFMQDIHARLALLKGQSDPLASVARELARHVRLLCLDEFHINDITDAMLMRGLLHGLCDQGVALVMTSNYKPDELYRNGLQRTRFMPSIDLIKTRLDVMHLDGGEDYRLRVLLSLEQDGLYQAPASERTEQVLHRIFHELTHGAVDSAGSLQISGRTLQVRCQGEGVVWFDFDELCEKPRSKADYIQLAQDFHTLLLSNVPQFHAQRGAEARRFLWLVDELYDSRVKLVLSAAVPLPQLGETTLLDGEFERVLSRLAEMQSRAYIEMI